MAQHDYILENQSRTSFRQDINAALAAIATSNSGSAQPSTTYALQLWADTASGLLKQRNSSNSAWVTLGPLDTPYLGLVAGTRNLLINGNPIINQRGYVSGTATTGANQYTLDRWRVVTSGQSLSWADSTGTRTVTAPAGGVEQVIEGLGVGGGVYTLNWTGTATATVNGSAVSRGGTVTLTGGSNATVRFSGGTFALAQLELGTVATPFERKPYSLELSLCQRYWTYIENVSLARLSSTGFFGGGITNYFFPATMRVAPEVTRTVQSGNYDDPAIVSTISGGSIWFNSGTTVGQYVVYTLYFNAEL